jgi:hypothetical protein
MVKSKIVGDVLGHRCSASVNAHLKLATDDLRGRVGHPHGGCRHKCVALSFASPARCQVCSREYLPFASDHLPCVQSIVARCAEFSSAIARSSTAFTAIRQVQ